MLKPGKMHEIAEQILNTQLQIVAIQEIRWRGYGHVRKEKCSLYYSCNPTKTGQFGTGFIVKKELVKNVLGFEPYNERICKLRLKGKFHNLSIICVHAPIDDKNDEIKEQFFEDLQKVYDQIPRHDIVILLGDMNAKIGREDVYRPVSGIHILHISNKNGELICEYAVVNNMSVMSTKFQHKRIRKGTWIAPDGQTLNQIDHVIVNKHKSSMIQDVKSMRGLKCDSDHFLVKIIVK
jgi:exonuclease III